MTVPVHPDTFDRTALISAHDGTQPTFEEALAAKKRTGVVIVAGNWACRDSSGQAALITAVCTAVRAFGSVLVVPESPEQPIVGGPFADSTLSDVVTRQGACVAAANELDEVPVGWPVLLVGAPTQPLSMGTPYRPVLRATWSGWKARVSPSRAAEGQGVAPACVLSAIAAGAQLVSEAFGLVRAVPGSDAGFRVVEIDLWDPTGDSNVPGPEFSFAPSAWWLVGLGHLGQAYAWVISWLPYTQAAKVEVVLQDIEGTVPANHSTGLFTPAGSKGVRKTRLVAAHLERAGLDTKIIERKMNSTLVATPDERHVALLGLDNFPTRRLISAVRWPFAIDVGLGAGPANFGALLMRRFPGAVPSNEVIGWQDENQPVIIPDTPAFGDLSQRHDQCGVVELAGKAVGASFVGVVAACFAVAEASRELHGGKGLDVLSVDTTSMEFLVDRASQTADVVSAHLLTPQLDLSEDAPVLLPPRGVVDISGKSGVREGAKGSL